MQAPNDTPETSTQFNSADVICQVIDLVELNGMVHAVVGPCVPGLSGTNVEASCPALVDHLKLAVSLGTRLAYSILHGQQCNKCRTSRALSESIDDLCGARYAWQLFRRSQEAQMNTEVQAITARKYSTPVPPEQMKQQSHGGSGGTTKHLNEKALSLETAVPANHARRVAKQSRILGLDQTQVISIRI